MNKNYDLFQPATPLRNSPFSGQQSVSGMQIVYSPAFPKNKNGCTRCFLSRKNLARTILVLWMRRNIFSLGDRLKIIRSL